MNRIVILLAAFFSMMSVGSIAQVTLKAGTKVYLITNRAYSSTTCSQGEMINMELYQDVKVNGKVVASSGSRAVGEMEICQKARGKGREGVVGISAKKFTCVDGTEVRLQKNILVSEGKDNRTEAVLGSIAAGCCVLPVAGFFAYFFIPGENATLPTQTLIEATVAEDYVIQVD